MRDVTDALPSCRLGDHREWQRNRGVDCHFEPDFDLEPDVDFDVEPTTLV